MEKHKQHTFKIVLTGPESTGKTALASALAEVLRTVWVPEFARFYLTHFGRTYTRADLQTIGRGQWLWEQWYGRQAGRFLVCDTDWTVLQIWEQFRFEVPRYESHSRFKAQVPRFPKFEKLRKSQAFAWHWQKGYGPAVPADLYLLCAPDFPPEPDPLRENPDEREILFEWYQQLLQDMDANFMVLWGEHPARLEQTMVRIKKIFGNLPV